MQAEQAVEFWHELASHIQTGVATADVVDPSTGEVIIQAGETVDADLMLRFNWTRRYHQHARRVNVAHRQECCDTCHDCGQPMARVLDGELWCDTCQAYR
jgi:hypothetical protein